MKHEIIKTENYLLIVDDSEIKEGDYYIDFRSDGLKIEHFKTKDDWVLVGICGSKKIIAHLPLNNSPILEGVDLLPPIDEIIKSLQQPKYPVGFECGMEICENNDVVFEDGSFNKPPYRLEKKKIKNSQGQTVWVGKYIFND